MGIPVFEAIISCVEDGIMDISLVDSPAVQSNFLAFASQSQPLQFKVENEEQHLITGVVMRCGYPIYRYDANFGEYYIVYQKDTIELMSKKMLHDGNHNKVTIMHEDGSEVEGVELVEVFIKNSSKGIAPTGFEDIEEYSLFVTYKVENEAIWSAIKEGTFKGFSLSGYFDVKKLNQTLSYMSMKDIVANTLIKYGEVATLTETLYWEGEEDLKAGDAVYVGEEKTPAPTGEYETEDGKVIKVEDGVVTEITDKEAEVAPEEPETKETEMADETPAEEPAEEAPAAEAPVYVTKEEYDTLAAAVEDLRTEVAALKEELSKPAAEPIVEEFKKVETKERKVSNAARILSNLRK